MSWLCLLLFLEVNMGIKIITIFMVLFLSGISFVFTQKVSDNLIKEIPFVYNKVDFGKVTIENNQKIIAESKRFPDDLPAHTCFNLEDKKKFYAFEKGARYFSPSYSFICFIPTSDKTEKDFTKSYPNFSQSITKLQSLIEKKPKKLKMFDNINDVPYNNSGWSVVSKTQYLSYENVEGVIFLTQYTQELTPNPLNNEELTYNFQGLTKNKRFYVAARFAVTHPNLPKGIDFMDDSIQNNALSKIYDKRDLIYKNSKLDEKEKSKRLNEETNKIVSSYLKKEEEKLESFDEATFKPSLANIKNLIKSISIK